jgi:hypothetical protein
LNNLRQIKHPILLLSLFQSHLLFHAFKYFYSHILISIKDKSNSIFKNIQLYMIFCNNSFKTIPNAPLKSNFVKNIDFLSNCDSLINAFINPTCSLNYWILFRIHFWHLSIIWTKTFLLLNMFDILTYCFKINPLKFSIIHCSWVLIPAGYKVDGPVRRDKRSICFKRSLHVNGWINLFLYQIFALKEKEHNLKNIFNKYSSDLSLKVDTWRYLFKKGKTGKSGF